MRLVLLLAGRSSVVKGGGLLVQELSDTPGSESAARRTNPSALDGRCFCPQWESGKCLRCA